MTNTFFLKTKNTHYKTKISIIKQKKRTNLCTFFAKHYYALFKLHDKVPLNYEVALRYIADSKANPSNLLIPGCFINPFCSKNPIDELIMGSLTHITS